MLLPFPPWNCLSLNSETNPCMLPDQLALCRSLGQNFLADTALLQSIAGAAHLQPGDRVLEIGPGKGGLTRQLLQSGASVLAIEKDARLVQQLHAIFGQVSNAS